MTFNLSPENPMLLLGCGNMGRAMLDGWLCAGKEPTCFVVVDPYVHNLPAGVAVYTKIDQIDRRFGLAMLAIKPQIFGDASAGIENLISSDALVLSLMAGTTIHTLQTRLPGRHIVRAMPNLAAAIGKAPIGLYSAQDQNHAEISILMQALGVVSWIGDEALMDAVTALAGSGPAFVYRFIDCLANAGAELGLDANQALLLAKAMVHGAAELAILQEISPSELAKRVTSPGGTTAAGLAVLDADDSLQRLVTATLTSARDRGVELSKPQ